LCFLILAYLHEGLQEGQDAEQCRRDVMTVMITSNLAMYRWCTCSVCTALPA
jgi:hypothetical protein